MSVRIAINPITWSNDDLPELGGDTPLEVALQETKQAGYDGTEMGGKFPRTAAELAPILAAHGLSFVSGWCSGKLLHHSVEEERREVESHLNLMVEMGCKVMIYADTTNTVQVQQHVPVSQRPRMPADAWADYGERLTRLAEHFLSRGVAMSFHHHMGTLIETEEEIALLMEHTGEAVGLLVDTGHVTYAGGDPVAVIQRHGPRINHFHCKDVRLDRLARAKQQDSSFLDAVLDGVFTVPGDGDIDFEAALTALKAANYQGDWLVVEAEQDPAKAHPLTYATLGYQTLRKLADRLGL